ncbi:hypothetical protein CEXT_201701 [Caerostris extrusa]|uniref:Uncharacterized protein n=1 Tax=Caerostris extrusa TaxID=172846 RepID=A0AAV4S3D9_CAEEX|nr:hypothetical protein CEXT_201701 [Caerostris extrusa]
MKEPFKKKLYRSFDKLTILNVSGHFIRKHRHHFILKYDTYVLSTLAIENFIDRLLVKLDVAITSFMDFAHKENNHREYYRSVISQVGHGHHFFYGLVAHKGKKKKRPDPTVVLSVDNWHAMGDG